VTQRVIGGQTYTLAYDAENRLITVTGPILTASFTYDADGKRVQSVINGTTIKFIGAHYEVEGTTIRKYYFAGSSRIAMRTGTSTPVYFLQDHLGSTSLTTDASGNLVAQMWYKAWGEVRYTSGSTPTKYTYTGQYSNTAEFGLMYYGARWYDPAISHFSQPDTLIPEQNDPQSYDRYSYTRNNPVNRYDPTGHVDCDDWDGCKNKLNISKINIVQDYSLDPKIITNSTKTPNPTLKPSTPLPTQTPNSPLPTQTPTPPLTTTPPMPPGWTPEPVLDIDPFYELRQITGNFDPFIPGPFTSIRNPYAIPAFLYDISYDLLTNTGEYSTINLNTYILVYQL